MQRPARGGQPEGEPTDKTSTNNHSASLFLFAQTCNDPRAAGRAPGSCSHGCGVEYTHMLSRCAATCDLESNRCTCGSRAKYPSRQARAFTSRQPPTPTWPLQDILLLRVVCAKINHPVMPPTQLPCPHCCNAIARLLDTIRPSLDLPFVCQTPYNIGKTTSCKGQPQPTPSAMFPFLLLTHPSRTAAPAARAQSTHLARRVLSPSDNSQPQPTAFAMFSFLLLTDPTARVAENHV